MRRIISASLLSLSVLLASVPLAAQAGEPDRTPEEQRAYQAFDAGDFEAAARAFGEAFRVTESATVKYNEAYAWQRAGRPGLAADAYTAALSLGGLDAEREQASRQRLTELRRTLGSVVVLRPVGGSVTLAHAVQVPIPTRIHVTPGAHLVVVRSSCGGTAQRRVELEATQSLEIDVTSSLAACPDSTGGEMPPGQDRPSEGSDDPGQGQRIAGSVLLATGAAAGVVAAVLGVQTLNAIDDFESTGNTDAELRDDAVALQTWTNVSWIAGAVLATAGLVVLLTSPDADETAGDPQVGLSLGPLGGGLAVSW